MKNAKRLIPSAPTPPSPPSAPSAPGTPDMPQAPEQSADSGSDADAGQPNIVAEIMKKIMGGGSGADSKGSGGSGAVRSQISMIGGSQGPSAETIQKWIKDFPLDKYRDENGVVRCPVPKEIRDKIMRRLKG